MLKNDAFLQGRMRALQHFLNDVMQSPYLRSDAAVASFLGEPGDEATWEAMRKGTAVMENAGEGHMRWLQRILCEHIESSPEKYVVRVHATGTFCGWSQVESFQPAIFELLLLENIKYMLHQATGMKQMLIERERALSGEASPEHKPASPPSEPPASPPTSGFSVASFTSAASSAASRFMSAVEPPSLGIEEQQRRARHTSELMTRALMAEEMQRFRSETTNALESIMNHFSCAEAQLTKRSGSVWRDYLKTSPADPQALARSTKELLDSASACSSSLPHSAADAAKDIAEAAAAAKDSPVEKLCWFLVPKEVADLVLPVAALGADGNWQSPTFRACDVVEQDVGGERRQLYRVALFGRMQLDVAVDALATGLSPRQASQQLAALARRMTRAGGEAPSFPLLTEREVRDLACLAMGESLQIVGRLLAGAWGFGLVLQEVKAVPTLPGAGYLDVRVVVYVEGELRDIHVLALPHFERRAAVALVQVIETVLDPVFPLWRTRVMGITHNGHDAIRGRADAATSDDQGTFEFPSISTFKYRTAEVLSLLRISILKSTPAIQNRVLHSTWGGCHQVNLALSAFYKSLLGGSFLPVLRTLIASVRQYPAVLQEMGQPPSVATRMANKESGTSFSNGSVGLNENADWLVMGLETQWVTDKRVRLRKQLSGSSSPSSSSGVSNTVDDVWWVVFFVVHWIATRANEAFRELRLSRVSRKRQTQIISELLAELLSTFNIREGEHREGQEQPVFSGEVTFSTLKSNVHDFIGDQGFFAINVADGLDPTVLDKVLENIATCLLSLVESLTGLSASLPEEEESVSANEDVELPPVMPQDLARLSEHEFTALLQRYRGQLQASFNEEKRNKIEHEYQEFHRVMTHDTELKSALEQCNQESLFGQAWALLKGQFPLLQACAGGLASAYVARDINCKYSLEGLINSGVAAEDDVLRLAAINFDFEAKLHAQQFDALVDLQSTSCASPGQSSG
ncbi:unnamed protein product [Phytophthora fragariaefolia]|uniref:Unnamed protein product n=1 Tax=Phytophthora fragariaefolia TaxID=1490495 RepID=A0A9W6YQ68_9STRA|nr:unnamed protein product [Phytophthora fragariaefolia]